MINVSKHALEMYALRIKEIPKGEVASSVAVNGEQYKSDLNKMYDNSKLIYVGKFDDKHKNTKFHVADDICMVVSADSSNIITLYRIDFGFNRTINKTIQKELMEELELKDNELAEVTSKIEEEKLNLMYQKDMINNEIESLKQTLKALEDNKRGLEEYIKNFGSEEKQKKEERDLVAKKIAYSVIYRKAVEDALLK